MNFIVVTQTQLASLLTHRNGFIAASQYETWQDYVDVIKCDLNISGFPFYDLDYFLGTAERRFYMSTLLLDSEVFVEFRSYLETTLNIQNDDWSEFMSIIDMTEFELQRYHKLILEFRGGSDQQGYTINGNEITLSDTNPLPLLGMSLVQTINSLNKIAVEMRFKIEKIGLVTLGSCNIGIGEPSSNNTSEIKYCISMVDSSDVIHYGVDAENLIASSVTHNNANWYGIAYTDDNSVVHRYSTDNCQTWTEIHTFEDVTLPGTLRALFNGQVALGQGQIQIKGDHIVAWAV